MEIVCGEIVPRDSEGRFLTEQRKYITRNFQDQPEQEDISERDREVLDEAAYVLAKKFSESMKTYEKEAGQTKELSPDMKIIAKIYKQRQREIRKEMEKFRKQNYKGEKNDELPGN